MRFDEYWQVEFEKCVIYSPHLVYYKSRELLKRWDIRTWRDVFYTITYLPLNYHLYFRNINNAYLLHI